MAPKKTIATVPPLPAKGQIVEKNALLQVQYAEWRNMLAFTGYKDPTVIWGLMTRNDASAFVCYRELMDKDDDIAGNFDEKKLSVCERNWTISPGDDSQAASDACDFMKAQFAGIDTDSFFDSLLDADPYGFSIAEMIFDTSAGQASLQTIIDAPQELFLFGDRFQPQIGPLQYLANGPYMSSGELVDENKFVIFTNRARAGNRMGRPMLKQCFWLSWIKRQTLGLWLKCASKNRGTAISRYASTATDAERAEAIKIAEALLESDAIAIPESSQYDEEMLKAGNVEKPELYEKLFEKQQMGMARLIKGETLTSFGNEGGKGSRAQGQVHAETFEQRSISLAKKASRVINMQVVKPLHLWNFGPEVPAPIFGFDVEEKKDLMSLGIILRNLQSMGVTLADGWVRSEFNVPAIADGDTVLAPNVAIAPETAPATAFNEKVEQTIVEGNLAQLDELTDQLQAESLKLLAPETRAIVAAMLPSLKRNR